VFVDQVSGKLARRPALDAALLSANRSGDQLVITGLDRLGRSLEHLMEIAAGLHVRGVRLGMFDQGIDTSTVVRRMLAAARARGRRGGQKPKSGAAAGRVDAAGAQLMYDELGAESKRRYTVAQIAAGFGVTRPAIYRHVQRRALVTANTGQR
jgi:DNA invertase Pin-like site-specific DNA recombinase